MKVWRFCLSELIVKMMTKLILNVLCSILSNNQLNGSIPESFSSLPFLQKLWASSSLSCLFFFSFFSMVWQLFVVYMYTKMMGAKSFSKYQVDTTKLNGILWFLHAGPLRITFWRVHFLLRYGTTNPSLLLQEFSCKKLKIVFDYTINLIVS